MLVNITYTLNSHTHTHTQILLSVKEIFEVLPSLVEVSIPDTDKFTVCGDIHGQFYDLLNIFKLNGLPSPDNPYVSLVTVM